MTPFPTTSGRKDESASADAELARQLADLEACLGTPLVPGELVTWFENAAALLGTLQPLVRRRATDGHLAKFAQIVREDPALQRSVERLGAEDEALGRTLYALKTRADRFAAKAAAIEPDEALMTQEWTRFVDEGLWFVVGLRKQETAIRTWLGEAQNRVRGAGD